MLLDLEFHAADHEVPHNKALVVLQLDCHVVALLLGCLKEVAVDELEVLVVITLEVVEAVHVHNETWVSNVVEGDVYPSLAVVVGFNDEEVVVIDEGVLLVKGRCHVKGFGVDGFGGYLGIGTSQNDGVRGVWQQGVPWCDHESSIYAGDKDRVVCIATLVKLMPL